MKKSKINNNSLIATLIVMVLLGLISCTFNPSKQKALYGIVEIKLVMDLDYKCLYYHCEDSSVINCEGQGKKCTQRIDLIMDSIPQLVTKAFTSLKKTRFEFNSNDGAYLRIVRKTNQKNDTLIFSGFNSDGEYNELKEVDMNIYHIYKTLKPCM